MDLLVNFDDIVVVDLFGVGGGGLDEVFRELEKFEKKIFFGKYVDDN